MDVVIVGAGIGGLALANGLLADGHRVRVLERAPGPRTDGAAVTVFGNGAAAAADLGVPLDGLGGDVETLEFCTPDGRPFARADLRVTRRGTGFGVATVPRAAILERFTGALPPGTVRYGRAVTDLRVGPDGVTVAGEPADVLVGADGYRSVVRRAVLDEAPATRNGWVSWQGLTRALPELAGDVHARCLVGSAGLCGLMPAGDGLLQWWFDVPEPAPDDRPVVEWLRIRFASYAEPVGELLAGLGESDVQAYPHVLHRVPARWGTGPVTLLGDAAHAFPPSQAQGANQALEDAWLLRRALGTPGDPTAALRRYERIRSRRVRRISRLAASEVTNQPPGALTRLAGRLLSPALTGRLHLATIRRCSSVLNDDRP
ncbi:FAD-dependent oxidoreductase [Plantactinospora sp. KLBMP9567]|uniref:FAD-dependent oxidoreductase n=1 Tax=Plantactinospora sp. KLBMP9567 TaxID=3085900 RepID=UPI002981B14A|nr:FAD-dependent monooxygenase [Plantactinospora sp. KLBMP9567]MDW5328941.1 FAD-dependent monooxygenase [Plantactinospora sp. KLBMP9567]